MLERMIRPARRAKSARNMGLEVVPLGAALTGEVYYENPTHSQLDALDVRRRGTTNCWLNLAIEVNDSDRDACADVHHASQL
jgi:hypothetical protein